MLQPETEDPVKGPDRIAAVDTAAYIGVANPHLKPRVANPIGEKP